MDDFIELVKFRQAQQAVKTVKAYCQEHKNCRSCGMFNGTCCLSGLPTDWYVKELEDDKYRDQSNI